MGDYDDNMTNATAAVRGAVPAWVQHFDVVGSVVYSIVFIVGLVGNATLIYIILGNKWMRTKSNVLIVSLAAGDFLLILVSVPFAALLYSTNGWWYGYVVCKISEFLQTFSVAVSVLTLTALSGDRLIAIVFPLYVYKSGSVRKTVCVAIVIWIVSLMLAIPDIVSAHVDTRPVMPVCNPYHADWGEWYEKFRTMFRFVVLFACPLIVITVFYSVIAFKLLCQSHETTVNTATGGYAVLRQMKSRRKVANIVLLFVAIFAVCWLPRHTFLLSWHYGDIAYNSYWHVFKAVGIWLTFVYSAANPFALYIISDQFRRYFDHYLCGRCVKSRRLPPNYDQRRSTRSSTTLVGQQLTTQHNISLEDLMDRVRNSSLGLPTSQTPGGSQQSIHI